VYLIAGKFRGQLCLRFVVCSRFTEPDDVNYTWNEIQTQADELMPRTELLAEVVHKKADGVAMQVEQGQLHARTH